MNWASLNLIWAVIAGIVSALFYLLAAVVKIAIRYGSLSMQVQTMWEFQMRRAMTEAVYTGIGQINSPLQFTPEAIAALEPIKDRLTAFWKTLPRGASDAEALLLIENQFGAELLTYLCLPNKLSHGACLLLALTIAKGHNAISFPARLPKRWWHW